MAWLSCSVKKKNPPNSWIQRYLIWYSDMRSPEDFKDRVGLRGVANSYSKLWAKAKTLHRDTASVPFPEPSELRPFPEAASSGVEAQGAAFLLQFWWEGTALNSLGDNTDTLSLLVLLKRKVFAGSHGACSPGLDRLWRWQMHLTVPVPLQDRDTNSVMHPSTAPV